jgi:hypothetical protein
VSPEIVSIGSRRLFKMAFGVGAVAGVDGVECGCKPNLSPGIAIVVVIILLLIAMGIVF